MGFWNRIYFIVEALILQLAMSMSVKKIAELVGETDTRIWRLIQRHVNNSYVVEDYSDVKK